MWLDRAWAGLPAVVRDGVLAGAVAAVVSGAPSTAYAVAAGDDPLEATAAAGSMLLRSETRVPVLLAAAVPVHCGLSLGWGVVLSAVLPRRRTVAWGSLAGLAIAALDLGVVGRRFARIRRLAVLPQVADHVLYGLATGMVLARRRGAR
jgi:hypothetical protein